MRTRSEKPPNTAPTIVCQDADVAVTTCDGDNDGDGERVKVGDGVVVCARTPHTVQRTTVHGSDIPI